MTSETRVTWLRESSCYDVSDDSAVESDMSSLAEEAENDASSETDWTPATPRSRSVTLSLGDGKELS